MKSVINIKNFRILEDITIDLRPTTFLLGPNGSGKSTFIKALFFLAENLNVDPSNVKFKFDLPNKNIYLRSFNDIVTNGDKSKKVKFCFEYKNKFSLIKVIPLYGVETISPFNEEDEYDYDISRCENCENQNEIRENVIQLSDSDNYDSLIEFFKLATKAELLKVFSTISNPVDFKYEFEFGKNSFLKELKFWFSDFYIEIFENEESHQSYYMREYSDDKLLVTNYKVEALHDEYDKIEQTLYEEIIEELKGQIKFVENKLTFNEIAIKIRNIIERLIANDTENNVELKTRPSILFNKSVLFYYQIKILFNQLFINSLIHYNFSGIRELPKYSYPLINSEFDKSEYYSLLAKLPSKDEYIKYLETRQDSIFFNGKEYENIGCFELEGILQKLSFGNMIYTIKSEDYGKVKLLSNTNEEIDLVNCSSGLLQVLPIILKIIDNEVTFMTDPEYRPRISIEQPELHLHPKLQTKLLEFLIKQNLLIETHSEHIIKKIQVLFAQGKVTEKDVVINYFDKDENGKIKIKRMEIDKFGFFKDPWPNGFFDESYDLTEQLLLATKRN